MSCLQVFEGGDMENPLICYIMNLMWLLSDKGTRVRFCLIWSHCGIKGNEKVDQLAKESLDNDIDSLARAHYADFKPLINSYIQQLIQIKFDVSVHGRYIYLLKPTLGPPKKFQHVNRGEEVFIIQLRIGHTNTKIPYLVPRTSDYLPPLWTDVDHWPHAIGGVQLCRKLWMNNTQLIVWRPSSRRFLRLAYWNIYEKLGCLIWLVKVKSSKWPYLCRMANMSCRTCVVVK